MALDDRAPDKRAFDEPAFATALLHGMSDAVVFADSAGVISFWSAGAVRIFGFTETEALGQSLDIIIPGNLRERHWDGFRTTMRSGRSRYGAGDLLAVPALRKDGTRISVEFTIVMFRGADGTMEGIAAVMRDVTTRFNELRALRRALAARAPDTGPSRADGAA